MATQKKTSSFSRKTQKITLSPGKILSGKYQYLNLLGIGGMGEVYLVQDIETRQKLAMKCCLNESYAKRFEQEVHSWLSMGRHPNVVTAIYFDWINNIPSLFIEYIDGTNLKAIIEESSKNSRTLSWKAALEYAIQISQGMNHLHASGVIHRDLKPSNILIARSQGIPDKIKITDMGLSKIKGQSHEENLGADEPVFVSPDITRTSDMLGTPQYMSPQQYLSSKAVGEDTDIYAFGIILYEMLAQGKKPFEVSDYQGWLYAHTYQTPKPIKSQVKSGFTLFRRKSKNDLYDIVMQCLAKKPEDRPKSFMEIEERLRGIYQNLFSQEYNAYQSFSPLLVSEKDLNNQAVSLMEMGETYTEEGRKKLEELCLSSVCAEAKLNQLLYYLKAGKTTLKVFWHKVKKIPENELDSQKRLESLIGSALERGSYIFPSLHLLEKNNLGSSSLLRLKAKLLHLSARYEEAIAIYKTLCEDNFCLWEDFYHLAGAIAQFSLQKQTARFVLQQNSFCLILEEKEKQRVWEILHDGEKKCGTNAHFDIAKDIVIGLPKEKVPFWHEESLWQAHNGMIQSLSICSNGIYALSAGTDKKIKLWDISHHKILSCFTEHKASITGACMSLDAKYAVSADTSGMVFFWDLRHQKPLASDSTGETITAITISANGTLAATADKKGIVKLWDLSQKSKSIWNRLLRKTSQTFKTNHGQIHSLGITMDCNYMIAGCSDHSIILWNLQNNQSIELQGHKGEVKHVALCSDSKFAITASDCEEDNLLVWDLVRQKKMLAFSVIKNPVSSLSIAANGRYLFLASAKGALIIWDLKSRKKIAFLEIDKKGMQYLSASPDAGIAISGGEDGVLHIWRNSFVWPMMVQQKYWKVLPDASN